tara:strand:- start:6284 stop:8614 length:2331 start_codon:yes stop_codon:yes gene_type:complete
MLKVLISLVILFLVKFVNPVFAKNLVILLPEPKPKIILNLSKKNEGLILPQKKPIFFKNKEVKKKFLLPEIKPGEASKKRIIVKDKIQPIKPIIEKQKTTKKITELDTITETNYVFILPQKKPFTYTKVVQEESPKSEVLSKRDYAIAKEVFGLIEQKKWKSAIKSTKRVKDNEFKNLVTWLYLKEKRNEASFTDYTNFIEKNPNYPRINRLKYLAEHKINLQSSSPSTIIGWFDTDPPLSGFGEIKLGESFLQKGRVDEASELIKKGWITASLSSKDLRYLNRKYKKILNSSDHIKRAEYMAWENKYWDLKRVLRYLPKDHRALYNARQILMSSSYGVDKAISDVPDIFKSDIGLRYNRLKWRRRRGRVDSSLEIINSAPNNNEELVRADLWWKERQVISRSLIYKKKYQLAYNVAKNHSLNKEKENESSSYAEAEWMSGWIASSFLKDYKLGLYHFNNFYKNVGYPISLARGAYWIGISYEKLGDEKLSKKYFREASKYLTTFYGQLAYQKVNPLEKFELKDDSKYSEEFKKKFNKNPLVAHVKLLKELNKTSLSKDILKHLASLDTENGSEVLAAELATKIGRYDFAIQISKKASYEKRFFNRFNYPIIDTPQIINGRQMPSQEIVLAITRQESEFDPKANSYAGAKGMMQLMTYTAKLVSKQMKVNYSKSRLTSDPDYNIKLGTFYFNSLLNEYGEIYPFAIAAYNAGPKRVKYWRKINGDPSKNKIDYVNWIELIKFKETRNYVQRVLENANVYRYMIEGKPVELKSFFKQ